ncbi:MAG: DUF3263 domain-containing protein [Actinobacteria bacterium]|uniref:DUF3263 domain-containing protein n=1 Tax=Candidatus Fonsibacter lacus TaxID=2576439 RepID=A0A965LKX6_9PROT|nr:DUF3263 domain-containing protein [Candidatus Fonsibacter lacus]
MGEQVFAAAAGAAHSPLSDQELAILEFERQWWRYPGSKEGAIRELFSMSSPRYYQLLNALLDRPEAEVAYPTLVRRLRRLRNSRTTGSKL